MPNRGSRVLSGSYARARGRVNKKFAMERRECGRDAQGAKSE
jgi:hypothetical protein